MSALQFFQPWMAIVGAVVMVAAVVHKRRYFQPARDLSFARRLFLVSAVYFIPAALGWFFIAGLGLRALADLGRYVPSGVASACGALGVAVLGFLILRPEFNEARKAEPKW
jgi:hypothetical protein